MWEEAQKIKIERTAAKGSLASRHWFLTSTPPYRKQTEIQKRFPTPLIVRPLVRPSLKLRHLRRSRALPINPRRSQAEVDLQESGLPASR